MMARNPSNSVWITPRQALADTAAGRFKLVFATQMNLMKLARFRTTAEAIAAAREAHRRHGAARGHQNRRHAPPCCAFPLEAGYGAAEFMVDNPPAS